jgi:glycosyltransferase involved in cell wall biosynthesis
VKNKIRVMLAGPYPHAGSMKGTFGRILENMQKSNVFIHEVEFIPHKVTLPIEGSFVVRFVKDFLRLIQALPVKPDIFHLISQKFRAVYREFPMIMLAKVFGIKTVVDLRAGSLQAMLNRTNSKIENSLFKMILRVTDVIVVECPKDIGYIKDKFGKTSILVPNALLREDFDRLKPTEIPTEKNYPLKLLYSGRYTELKGISEMFKALEILSERGLSVELHLTGQGEEEDFLKKIEENVKSPPKGTKIKDHGWDVGDLNKFISAHHIFIMPTVWPNEGHPNSVTEAMMAGLGLILTDWFHREDVVPEESAKIIPPKDPESLANAIEFFIENRDCLAEMGKFNREYVGTHYLDDVCYKPLLEIFQTM